MQRQFSEMRNINSIILHCSDSNHLDHDDISVINEWHLAKGWDGVGYHVFIKRDGTAQEGRKFSKIGAHCKGFNSTSIGICLSGRDEFTKEQWESLFSLVDVCCDVYDIELEGIYGHYELNNSRKTCPNFKINEFKHKFNEWKEGNNAKINC